MLRISLVLALASMACHHDAPPPSNQAGAARALPTADPLAFLPLNADFVVAVDARSVRASALWAQYKPKLLEGLGARLAIVQRTCGFDPIETIQSVTVGAYAKGSSGGVIVIRGLDRERMTACLRSNIIPDTTVTTDRDVLVLTDKNGDRHRIVFADATTLVAQILRHGEPVPEDLHAVLQRGSPLRGSPAFLEMFERLDRSATVWAVLNGTSPVFDDFASLGTRPRAVYGSLRLANGLVAKLHIRMVSVDAATQLTTLVQGQIQTASAMFDRLVVVTEQDVTTITAEMSLDKLQKLASMALMMASPPAATPPPPSIPPPPPSQPPKP